MTNLDTIKTATVRAERTRAHIRHLLEVTAEARQAISHTQGVVSQLRRENRAMARLARAINRIEKADKRGF